MTRVRVEAVLVGRESTVQVGAARRSSGIRKVPQPGRVAVTAAGLAGDHVHDTAHHGGPDQAAYVYTRPDLDAWTEALGDVPDPGLFGENLVLGGLESARLRVGDRLDVSAPDGTPGPLLEVTAPRIPCATLAAHVGDPGFVRRFTALRRPGAYTRVLRAGTVAAGDHVTVRPAPTPAPDLGTLFDVWHDARAPRAVLLAALEAPLALRLRRALQERLDDAGGP